MYPDKQGLTPEGDRVELWSECDGGMTVWTVRLCDKRGESVWESFWSRSRAERLFADLTG